MWKNFFYYSRNEQKGIVILLILIAIVIVIRILLPFILLNQKLSENQIAFINEVNKINQIITNENRIQDTLFVFNPNTISSEDMYRLGFSSYQINSLLGYRNKIGDISSLDDLKNVYGVDSAFIKKYVDYIYFNVKKEQKKNIVKNPVITWINFNKVEDQFWDDNIYSIEIRDRIKRLLEQNFVLKQLPFNTVNEFGDQRMLIWLENNSKSKNSNVILNYSIDLNLTDTIELKRIKGIGSILSKRILKYKELLGGYVQVAQLSEVYGISDELYDQIKNYFVVDASKVDKIDLSKDKISEICKHPYFNYSQTTELVNLSRKGIVLSNYDGLTFKNITQEEWGVMKLYLKLGAEK